MTQTQQIWARVNEKLPQEYIATRAADGTQHAAYNFHRRTAFMSLDDLNSTRVQRLTREAQRRLG